MVLCEWYCVESVRVSMFDEVYVCVFYLLFLLFKFFGVGINFDMSERVNFVSTVSSERTTGVNWYGLLIKIVCLLCMSGI